MGVSVEIVDKSTTGDVFDSIFVELSPERMTVRQLIKETVTAEVEKANNACDGNDTGQSINVDSQIKKALLEFQSNGFFILVDNGQVESLDTVIWITESTRVSFVRLVPMVGG